MCVYVLLKKVECCVKFQKTKLKIKKTKLAASVIDQKIKTKNNLKSKINPLSFYGQTDYVCICEEITIKVY